MAVIVFVSHRASMSVRLFVCLFVHRTIHFFLVPAVVVIVPVANLAGWWSFPIECRSNTPSAPSTQFLQGKTEKTEKELMEEMEQYEPDSEEYERVKTVRFLLLHVCMSPCFFVWLFTIPNRYGLLHSVYVSVPFMDPYPCN